MRYGMLEDMYFEEYQQKIRDWDFPCTSIDAALDFLESAFLPVRYRGTILPDYYVDARGQIFSTKKSFLNPTKLQYNCNDSNRGYPKIRIDVSGRFSFERKYKTVSVHRLVCESHHMLPIPDGVSKKEWAATPESVKRCFNDYWEVNHIDHNTYNYHPNNLEWVSRQQNVNKYQDTLREKQYA